MTQQPSPTLFFRTINAYQQTQALKAAIELSVFTAIAKGVRTADKIAACAETSPRGMRILCDYLVCIGFLTKERGEYGLTLDSATSSTRLHPPTSEARSSSSRRRTSRTPSTTLRRSCDEGERRSTVAVPSLQRIPSG